MTQPSETPAASISADARPASAAQVSAAMLIIGDEILSGRTRDANLHWLAERLGEQGIAMREVRIVPDIEAEIVDALNALRDRYRYVFTTGGIGPTHDDITAQSVAAAFGVALERNEEAVRLIAERAGKENLNEARLRMANIPAGGTLIYNSLGGAPGFRIGNVFVMAGVPSIMQVMFEAISPTLEGGIPMLSRTIHCNLAEGTIAAGLGSIQETFADVGIGSYPYFRRDRAGVNIVLRSPDQARLEACTRAVEAMIHAAGGTTEPPDSAG